MSAKKFWEEFKVHMAVYLTTSLVMTGVGFFIGYPIGKEKGEKVATEEATKIATKAADATAELLTGRFIDQEVESRYKLALEVREKNGYEKGRFAAGNFCALEDYYRIIRGYLSQGASIRSSQDAMRITQNINRVRAIGSESIGEVATKVLNGTLTDLEDAYKRGDAERVKQLLMEISESLPARDRSFQVAKEKLVTAK